MKLIAKPVEAIFWSNLEGVIRPLRFKYQDGDDSEVVIVNKIFSVERTKKAGEDAFVFTCESLIKNQMKLYELRYTLSTCQWVLYKI